MDEKQWERWGALGGVVFVVLVVVSAVIGGSPPKPTDSALKIAKYFRDNQDALKIGSYLNGIGLVVFLWFLATLFGRLRRAEGGSGRVSGIALTGAVVALTIATVANGITAYAVLHPLGSASSFQVATILFGYAGFAIAVFVAATSIVVLRTSLLPRWLGWIGAVVALLWLVGAAAVSTENDTINGIGFVVFLLWAIWLLVVSALLYRATTAAPEPATGVAA
jgi:hypothetical protein